MVHLQALLPEPWLFSKSFQETLLLFLNRALGLTKTYSKKSFYTVRLHPNCSKLQKRSLLLSERLLAAAQKKEGYHQRRASMSRSLVANISCSAQITWNCASSERPQISVSLYRAYVGSLSKATRLHIKNYGTIVFGSFQQIRGPNIDHK